MFSLYLNSLYKLLFENNPVWNLYFQCLHTLQSILGYRHNMDKAADKLHRLENRLAMFEHEVHYDKVDQSTKFDLYR